MPAAALRDRATSLPAVVAAYLLVAQLLVVPVGLGTSAHLVGTGLAALLVGPAVAILCVAVVVVVLRRWCWPTAGSPRSGSTSSTTASSRRWWPGRVRARCGRSWRPARALGRRGRASPPGSASLAAAGAAALEFVVGGTDAVSPATVAASIGGAHLLVAALEGVLTALALGTILRLRPDLVRGPSPAAAPGRRSRRGRRPRRQRATRRSSGRARNGGRR